MTREYIGFLTELFADLLFDLRCTKLAERYPMLIAFSTARLVSRTVPAFAIWGLVVLCSSCGGNVAADPPVVQPGFCAKQCKVTADCCPSGVSNCPGVYPNNYSCEGGLCKAPHCVVDADCKLLSSSLPLACRAVTGHLGCLVICSADADCATMGLSGMTCSGHADDGSRTCTISSSTATLGCKSDANCPANRHCQSGICGCAADTECKPSLDVCTTDRSYAYPASAGVGMPQ